MYCYKLARILAIYFSFIGRSIATPSTGCSLAKFHGGTNTTHNITSNGIKRSFIINLPKTYNALQLSKTGAPLIIGFHGSTRTAAYFQTMSQYCNTTLNTDHVTVFPQGINDHWQGSPLANASVNDIEFIGDLFDYLQQNYCLDTTRIYASGHSNGGGFANTIACWPGLSGRFAAYAVGSAAIYNGSTGPNGSCMPDHTITPMLEFHGKADTTIPYYGGAAQGWTVPPILNWTTSWVTRNGCLGGNLTTTTNGTVTRYYNTLCNVQQWTFQYLPHLWACNTSSFIPPGDFLTPVEATSVAMAFFRANHN